MTCRGAPPTRCAASGPTSSAPRRCRASGSRARPAAEADAAARAAGITAVTGAAAAPAATNLMGSAFRSRTPPGSAMFPHAMTAWRFRRRRAVPGVSVRRSRSRAPPTFPRWKACPCRAPTCRASRRASTRSCSPPPNAFEAPPTSAGTTADTDAARRPKPGRGGGACQPAGLSGALAGLRERAPVRDLHAVSAAVPRPSPEFPHSVPV